MLLPYVASAEGVECAEGIKYEGVNLLGVLCVTQLILRRVVVLLVSFAVIFFIYGIIGLFVMVSMWGLVFFLGSTFSISREAIDLPNLIP